MNILITTLYNTNNELRNDELKLCYNKNIRDVNIDHIVVFLEGNAPFNINKNTTIVNIDERPTYTQMINYVNRHYPEDVIIIANADIYFNETLSKLSEIEYDNKLIALTRFNIRNLELSCQSKEEMVTCSDVWIFKSPVNISCDIGVGVCYCDGRLLLNAHHAGYKVVNYTKDITSIHIHDQRNYRNKRRRDKKYRGKSLYVQMTKINENATRKPEPRQD